MSNNTKANVLNLWEIILKCLNMPVAEFIFFLKNDSSFLSYLGSNNFYEKRVHGFVFPVQVKNTTNVGVYVIIEHSMK